MLIAYILFRHQCRVCAEITLHIPTKTHGLDCLQCRAAGRQTTLTIPFLGKGEQHIIDLIHRFLKLLRKYRWIDQKLASLYTANPHIVPLVKGEGLRQTGHHLEALTHAFISSNALVFIAILSFMFVHTGNANKPRPQVKIWGLFLQLNSLLPLRKSSRRQPESSRSPLTNSWQEKRQSIPVTISGTSQGLWRPTEKRQPDEGYWIKTSTPCRDGCPT